MFSPGSGFGWHILHWSFRAVACSLWLNGMGCAGGSARSLEQEVPDGIWWVDLARAGSAADVIIMPYADRPVTRAMQPLKLKEYLATGKPVVVRNLPATRGWTDCLDLADTLKVIRGPAHAVAAKPDGGSGAGRSAPASAARA